MTPADDLLLTQWLSPAFPLGGFAYSHGLEQAVADGAVHDAATLRGWLARVLEHGAGLADAVLLVATLRGRPVDEMDAMAAALAASRERWAESRDQGDAFARTVTGMGGAAIAPAALPVAVGAAARRLDLPAETVAARFLHAFAATLVGGAQRLMPLGQTRAQALLAGLAPVVLDTVARACTLTPDEITGSVPAGDLAAMRHETLQPRIFRS